MTSGTTSTGAPASPEAAYLGQRQQEYAATVKAVGDMESQISVARANPSVVAGSDWQARTNQDLAAIQSGARQFQQPGSAPGHLGALDATFVSTGQDILSVAGTIAGSVQSGNAQQIAGAASQVQRINSDLMKLNQQLGDAFQKYGVTRPAG